MFLSLKVYVSRSRREELVGFDDVGGNCLRSAIANNQLVETKQAETRSDEVRFSLNLDMFS